MHPRSLLALALAPLALGAAAPSAPDPWEQASLGLFKDAHNAFATATAADRETRFGQAVTLINLQPKTEANLDRAAEILRSLAAPSAAPATDDLALSARYFLGRIAQVHRRPPNLAEAKRIYRELAELDTRHPLAQRAVVHLALIELFEPGLPVATVRELHESFARRADRLTDPAAIRDFNLVLGDAAIRFELGDAIALRHLAAADQAGIARSTTQADTLLRIAELARRIGDSGTATAYYRRFLDENRRDPRRLTVMDRLAALGADVSAKSLPTSGHGES